MPGQNDLSRRLSDPEWRTLEDLLDGPGGPNLAAYRASVPKRLMSRFNNQAARLLVQVRKLFGGGQ